MEIILVRHTKTKIDSKEYCYGQMDVELLPDYREEFAEVISSIKNLGEIDLVYSSPLARCADLALAIAHESGVNVLPDDRLLEMDFGEWQGERWKDIEQNQMVAWMQDLLNYKVPNGESLLDVSKRVQRFFTMITTPENHDKRIVVVSHAGTIRVALSYLNSTPLLKMFELYKVNHGSVQVVREC